MFHSKKSKQIAAAVIAIILVLAMVIPSFLSVVGM